MSVEKGKISSPFHRFFRMQSAPKLTISLIGFLFIVALTYYATVNNDAIRYSKDRSESYRVKVLPMNLDDVALSNLEPQSYSYLAMIDAGSSGCRAHVYRYGKLGEIEGPLYVIPRHNSKKVKPGLSSFSKTPTEAGASLAGLVDFIKEQVPEVAWKDTPIWLKATAGLRMLEPAQSEAILVSVRGFLGDKEKSPFLFRNSYASIISGNEEGGFGWVSYNYLKKIIGPKKTLGVQPYAVIEMGGASTQVSQIAPTPEAAKAIPKANLFSFTIEDTVYELYTHSYLGFGGERARAALSAKLASQVSNGQVQDPCLNAGYSRDGTATPLKDIYEGPDGKFKVSGSAAAGSCIASAKSLFEPSSKCSVGGPHTFSCVHQPDFVRESTNFLVFENFFYVSSATGVLPAGHPSSPEPPRKQVAYPLITTPAEFEEASNLVCGQNWTTVNSQYPLDTQPKDNLKWCFMSGYTTAFLTAGVGLPKDKPITVQQNVDGADIEWALGAAYKEAAELLKRTNLRPT